MEERLFSTGDSDLDLLLTEVYYSGIEDGYDYAQREFSEKEEKKKSGLKTAGKALLGTGAAMAVGGAIGENAVANKVMKKVAEKKGLVKGGWGMASRAYGPGADHAVELTGRALNRSKAFKTAARFDTGGTVLALTGAGLLAANAIKNKRNKKKENEG